jgi:predicted glycosyltransferase
MGARAGKVRRHQGLKEHVQLAAFTPDEAILDKLGVARHEGGAVVVTRPPPSRAAYHRFGNPAYDAALERLGAQPQVQVVALARHPEQRAALAELGLSNLTVPQHAVDARSLMRAADLVIGAGGTMTREAALLGVPTLTAFAGERPAVDRWLEAQGLLDQLTDPAQVASIRPRDREPVPLERLADQADEVIAAYVDAVVQVATG